MSYESWRMGKLLMSVLPGTELQRRDLPPYFEGRTLHHNGPHKVVDVGEKMMGGTEGADIYCLLGCPQIDCGPLVMQVPMDCLGDDAYGPGVMERLALGEARTEMVARRAA